MTIPDVATVHHLRDVPLKPLGTVLSTSPLVVTMPGLPFTTSVSQTSLFGIATATLLILGGFWLARAYRRFLASRSRSKETPSTVSAYDSVTGLPTRRLFVSLLGQAVSRARQTGRAVAVLVIELDHFKMVSESQGHANGNMLIRIQAARVKSVLRAADTLARLAQDQFAMIVDNVTCFEDIPAMIEKMQATVGLPLSLDGHELFLSCRIGGASFPHDAAEHADLIERAVLALKTAKSEGQPVYLASGLSLSNPSSARIPVAQDMRAA